MRPILFATLLLFTACGLAEDPRDEENKYIYITFSDPNFGRYCIDTFDTNGDGRLSRYEAQRVRTMRCPGLGIESMVQVSEFSHLQTLDCSDNLLVDLDLRKCMELRTVDCSGNRLVVLDVDDLRGLVSLDCADNQLQNLNLGSNSGLSTFVCRANLFSVLDVSRCASEMSVDARYCPSLTALYIARGQRVNAQAGSAQIIER